MRTRGHRGQAYQLASSLAIGCLLLWARLGGAQPTPTPLVHQLGCANCHKGLPLQEPLAIPNLSGAGLRYQPAYLFSFLQNPAAVRRHLGAARMPGFHLTSQEAAALVAFLLTQREEPLPMLSADLRTALEGPVKVVTPAEFNAAGPELCLTCHTLGGNGGALAPELSTTGYRLNPSWVRGFVAGPERYGVPSALMPALPLPTNPMHPAVPTLETARRIRALTDYLFGLAAPQRKELEQSFAAANGAGADPALGKEMFVALNCAGCHSSSIEPRRDIAPDLALVAQTTRENWLRDFLRDPHALRPAGYHPGDGSRMPQFRLTDQEAMQVIVELKGLGSSAGANLPIKLSAFADRKARQLLEQKLACLGCHRLGQRGGRIGPDLTDVGLRRPAQYIREMILNPRLHRPESIMPKIPMPTNTVELIIAFLAGQTNVPSGAEYLPLAALPLMDPSQGTQSAQLYHRHCAVCHGAEGGGDGFNAQFLPVRPTAHRDTAYMSRRPNDTLFDGIYAGGAILNRSHLMPPWGRTFQRDQIAGLVKHLRFLCGCSPPAWSLDPRDVP